MPGLHVTDRQVRRYMTSRREGQMQAVAAAQAGFSERTGRRIEAGPTLPSQKPPLAYRTRADPLAEVWREELVPLLETVPHIRATSLLEELDRRHPGRFGEGVLRSLQRRVAHWRATQEHSGYNDVGCVGWSYCRRKMVNEKQSGLLRGR